MNRTITFSIITLLFVFCDEYNPKLITIRMINELQECEEVNLHYKITGAWSKDTSLDSLIGKIVLPVLSKQINDSIHNKMLFPGYVFKRIELVADGKMSKGPHNKVFEGCTGAHSFKVLKILKYNDVTKTQNFPISYNQLFK